MQGADCRARSARQGRRRDSRIRGVGRPQGRSTPLWYGGCRKEGRRFGRRPARARRHTEPQPSGIITSHSLPVEPSTWKLIDLSCGLVMARDSAYTSPRVWQAASLRTSRRVCRMTD